MSVFLSLATSAWVASNDLAFAVRDPYPVSPGHTLVITKRVVADWFGATRDEQLAILSLIDDVKAALDVELAPHGYNVGFNAGSAAGQTVPHLHVHLIPRFEGDMEDPRGGVRHVIPDKGNYMKGLVPGVSSPPEPRPSPLATGGAGDPFARHVLPLFDRASDVAIVAAFVMERGLSRIEAGVDGALARGARVRLVTGDYLAITQSEALKKLLDWQRASRVGEGDDAPVGRFEVRIIETEMLAPMKSFHPKSWRFGWGNSGVAFVGSSNLSHAALGEAIEWNLRVDRDRDPEAYARVHAAFEQLWGRALAFDEAWVERYAERVRGSPERVFAPPDEIDPDERPVPVPEPHEAQAEALENLRAARREQRRRALVVFATGLGKTWLAAFDWRQLREELERRPRLLFVAHRKEILRQAAGTYRALLRDADPTARITWFDGEGDDMSGDLVFASVAKLARREQLERLRTERFDYVVVDEVHHAAAESYRRILAAMDPGFLLGLTATPDRADQADILGLFDDFVAHRVDIARGVELGRLVPFRYFGVKDAIDYENIPWRNRRFDPAELAAAAQTEARMQTLWRAWGEHPAGRTLVFCCSVEHARFVRDWLAERDVRVRAVFADEGSDDREQSLEDLAGGTIDAVCAVDMFNEGIDVPSIDRVVMLRPTESSVIFLQQLGRGLRAGAGKADVTVIDFVGNHRIFLERVRALLSMDRKVATPDVASFLDASTGPAELAAGCSVEIELEAKELLRSLFKIGGADNVERAYRELRLERGQRPTAGEMQRLRYLPGVLRKRHNSWFAFVAAEADLADDERAAYDVAGALLREIELTEMTRSFKMVTLLALLELGELIEGAPLRDVALRSHAILRRSPELFAEVAEPHRADTIDASNERDWIAYWRKSPIEAWTSPKKDRRAWFRLDGERFTLDAAIPPHHEAALSRLVYELVDYRLAEHRARSRQGEVSAEGFVCRVTWNQRDPILKLPRARGAIPSGEIDVRLPDGSAWQFRLGKEFCNVARPAGTQRNALPDLLRRWFGPSVGQPGTASNVRFYASPDGLWVEPLGASVVALEPRRGVAAYPDLRAAAGHASGAAEHLQPEDVLLPIDAADPDRFAVRVAGSSMDGGAVPLQDGDWAVMKLARGAPASALEGRVVLFELPGEPFGRQYQIKRLALQPDGSWQLRSDNPDGPTIEPTAAYVPIARLERAFHPEDLAPAPGTVVADAELPAAFALPELELRSARHSGHLFLFIDQPGTLIEPDRLRFEALAPRPSETAFVLARATGGWRYLGVARQTDDPGLWSLPEVDFTTWRAWGVGREVSRRLPQGAIARAQQVVDAILSRSDSERVLRQADGRTARVLGAAPRGGIRIAGEQSRERTVSLTDIAWAIVAAKDVEEHGGILDEQRVNRLRYIEGTPTGSTRWIDTRWAIAGWQLVMSHIRAALASDHEPLVIHDDDGRALDARFRLERLGDATTLVIESSGGTHGSAARRNGDYNPGFELILRRIGDLDMRISDAFVDSRETASLSAAAKRLVIEDEPYPIIVRDARALRRKMSSAQARVARAPGATGRGNSTRRVRLVLLPPTTNP